MVPFLGDVGLRGAKAFVGLSLDERSLAVMLMYLDARDPAVIFSVSATGVLLAAGTGLATVLFDGVRLTEGTRGVAEGVARPAAGVIRPLE